MKFPSRKETPRPALHSILALVALAALAGGAAHAVTVTDLYESSQPVVTSRDDAFVDALKRVVVRVSGQRDAPARLGAALSDPRRYVQRYGFTADEVLQVGFDSVSIDRLLLDAGLPIWGRERPATLVVLGVDEPTGSTRWVSAQTPPADRETVEQAAQERGLPLVWAALDTHDYMIIDGSAVGIIDGSAAGTIDGSAAGSASTLLQLAQSHGANAVLVGRIRDGSVSWTLASADGVEQTAGGLGDGVHLAADSFARVFAASGSSLDAVIVEVSGLTDLNAYAATLNYLEGMTLVRNVALEQVAGDTMRFRLAVRGDIGALRRAIALDDRLAPLTLPGDPAVAGDRLTFRYQP